ncbi:MAG: MTH938/NDUFAF3 family protein [Bacteroidales bacterium]
MKPEINHTAFGSITVEKHKYGHDVYIRADGEVKKRKKKLSKRIYGTSHTISLEEIKYIFDKNTEGMVIGTGQYGVARLSDEAAEFLEKKHCRVILEPTPRAIKQWNQAEGKWIGLFHITC